MATTTYRPGAGIGIVGPDAVAVIAGDPLEWADRQSPDAAGRWARSRDHDDDPCASVRLVGERFELCARGGASVRWTMHDGVEQRLDGHAPRSIAVDVASVAEVTVALDGSEPASSLARLPIGDGVVLASSVTRTFRIPTSSSVSRSPVDTLRPDDLAVLETELDQIVDRGDDLDIARSARARSTIGAVHCRRGHPNAPGRVVCRRCGEPCDAVVVERSDVAVAVLVTETGERIDVDRTIVLGRDPQALHPARPDDCRLVTVDDPTAAVGRSHAAIIIDGWSLALEDLHSTNGTAIVDGGRLRQLRSGQVVAIVDGAEIVLGGVARVRVEAAG